MSHDTLLHRLIRPAIRRIAPSGVTPNQITTLRLATGVAAALGFAQGGALWPAVGGAVFLASMLLDRADGELARYTGRTSPGGYRYDLACDCLATIAAFLGMGWGSQAVFGPLAVLLGAVAGVSVAAVFWLIHGVKLTPMRPAREGKTAFDPDDAMLLAPVLVWLGLMPWTVVIAAIATPVVALVLAVVGLQGASARRSLGKT